MPTTAAPKTSDHFSLSGMLSTFRSKRHSKRPEAQQKVPPQDPRPPLNFSPLPLVLLPHQPSLAHLGWTTLTFPHATTPSQPSDPAPGPHPLQLASQDLFAAAQLFFDLPDDEKARWKHRLGSEEGWSKIPGEKEFITLRTLAYTPDGLQAPAKRYWDTMGALLDASLGRISASLGLPDAPDAGLRAFVCPCARMGAAEEDKTATMLRIFRYEGWDAKVVAEPHADLGLLSCVVGDVPGLEVWNGRQFAGVERHYKTPCATLLAGRQLERYSNFRYPAGGHRVVSYGREADAAAEEKRFRHSIVFVLRAYEPVVVDSDALETEITGRWKEPVKGVTAGQMYREIRSRHFNINIGMEEREKQRRKLREGGGPGQGKTDAREASG